MDSKILIEVQSLKYSSKILYFLKLEGQIYFNLHFASLDNINVF